MSKNNIRQQRNNVNSSNCSIGDSRNLKSAVSTNRFDAVLAANNCCRMRELWVIMSILTVAAILSPMEGKIYTNCEVVKELQRAKINRSFFSNWVCLMQSESGMNTTLMTGPKTASSYSFGILQISSGKWCTRGRKGGTCNKRCEDFLNDDIQDDIACGIKIFNQDGFKAWEGWSKKCKNKPNNLPNIANCKRRRRAAAPVESDRLFEDLLGKFL